ncbi:MAG: hypothetical protein J5659_01385 [Clostridia bacterium]|nr:hypothetical protein [Clostridia bacterium]
MRTAVVLGTFDGLHEGHRAVLAEAAGYYTVAVTFDIPPKAFFGGSHELLMTPEDKSAGLKALGVSEILTLDFSRVFNMSPEEFFNLLKEKYKPALIVCGFNYRFGSGAKGDTERLFSLCKESKIRFKCVACVGGEQPICSSVLRKMILSGDVSSANKQIFGGFGFASPVIHGDARGRTLGFPTINQKFPEVLVKPKFGVYKSKVIIGDKEYDGVTDVGVRPTFMTDFIGCETFVKDFNEDIYDSEVRLKLIDFIRKEEKFSTAEALKSAVAADIKSALGIEIKEA